jgi:hypothetical protein
LGGQTLFGEVPLGLEALFLPQSKEVVRANRTTRRTWPIFASRAGASNEEWTVNAVTRLQALPHTAPRQLNLEAVQKISGQSNWMAR